MKKNLNNPAFFIVVACVISCSLLTVLSMFPLRSEKTIWKGYRVLVLNPANSEAEAVARLDKAGIDEYATESNTRLGNTSLEAPIEPFIDDINRARAHWFSDEEHDLRFIYLKESSFLDRKIAAGFSSSDLDYYLEESSDASILPVLALLVLLGAGLFTAGNRLAQLFAALPVLLLAYSCSRLLGFISALFLLEGIILTASLCETKGLRLTGGQILKRLRLRPYPLALFVPAMIFAISGGFHAGLLAVCALVTSFALAYVSTALRDAIRSFGDRLRFHPRFEPLVMYRGGTRMFPKKTQAFMLSSITLISLVAGIVSFSMRSGTPKIDSGRVLYIPAPAEYTRHAGFDLEGYTELLSMRSQTTLPDLGDFVAARWNIRIAPWRRVQDPPRIPEAGTTAEFVSYSADSRGIITGKSKTLYTFDTGFIKKILSSDGTRLEKMLLRQDRFVTVQLTRLE